MASLPGRAYHSQAIAMRKLDQYLTVRAAAQYLAVCPNTLRSWSDAGKVRVRRHPVNGYRLYELADLERLLLKVQRSIGSRPTRAPRRPR